MSYHNYCEKKLKHVMDKTIGILYNKDDSRYTYKRRR